MVYRISVLFRYIDSEFRDSKREGVTMTIIRQVKGLPSSRGLHCILDFYGFPSYLVWIMPGAEEGGGSCKKS